MGPYLARSPPLFALNALFFFVGSLSTSGATIFFDGQQPFPFSFPLFDYLR